MLVELDDEHTKCSICITKFSSDRENKNPEIRKHLPVLSSSQRCDHWFCHGCVLREQLRVAEENNGKVPKWIKCMQCREKTSFNPAEPKYHRLLIDLLGRAQKYAAAQMMKNENEGMNADADAQFGSERATSIKIKRESDIGDDEEEHEAKRSKLISPSMSTSSFMNNNGNSNNNSGNNDSNEPSSGWGMGVVLPCNNHHISDKNNGGGYRYNDNRSPHPHQQHNYPQQQSRGPPQDRIDGRSGRSILTPNAAAQVKNEDEEISAKALNSADAMRIKRESDAVSDEVNRELKRPKLMTPSPQSQLVQVKEEPVECDDDYCDLPLQESSAQLLKSDSSTSIKRESDEVDDEEEQELNQPKLTKPSPPLLRIKDEPVEYGDQHVPRPLLESASSSSEITQSAITSPLVCSTCKVPKSRCNFSESDELKGDAAVCNECVMNDNPKFRPMREALNTAEQELSTHYNIADGLAEGLEDIAEKEGGRMAQLTRECIVALTKSAEHPRMLLCYVCKEEKELNQFSKKQRKLQEAASCIKCIEKVKIICPSCKELKWLCMFPKMQRKQGDAACCEKCIKKEAKTILRCSTCKEEKELKFFSKIQRMQGEAACCHQCVHKCSACKEVMKLNQFSKKQRKLQAAARCIKCIQEALVKQHHMLPCSRCKEVKVLSKFPKMQRKQGDAACCIKCIKKEAKTILRCSTCKEEKKLDFFSKIQRMQGEAACCQQCVQKDQKANSIPQMRLCSTCKEEKELNQFSKKQRKQGEAACCLQCVHKNQEAKACNKITEKLLHSCMNCVQEIDEAKSALSKTVEG